MDNQELIGLIEHDLVGTRPKHDQQINRIKQWIGIYEGKPYGNEDKARSDIVWKLVQKQGESLISNLSKQFLGQHQIVDMVPATAKDAFKSDIYTRVINHFWTKEFNSTKFIKTLTRLLVKEGTAFVRVGWEQDIDIKKTKVSGLTEELVQKITNDGATIEQTGPDEYTITKKIIKKNRATAKVIRTEDVYFDPTADDFESLRFLIYDYATSLSDMAKQPHLYDPAAVAILKKNLTPQDDGADTYDVRDTKYNQYGFEFQDDARKKVRLYEYWGEYDLHKTGKTVPIVAVMAKYGQQKVIVRLEENTLPFKSIPFVCIPLIEEEFNVYGLGLADMIADEQKFSTSIIRGIQDNMSMSNKGTKFVKKNALDTENYTRLMNGNAVVEVNTHENINTAVMDGNFNPLPQSVYNMLSIIDTQAESMTGISKMMQGIPGVEMKAASSNFSAVMSQSQIRLLDMTTNMTTGLRYMFRMWSEMAMEYLDDTEVQDITGVYIPEEKVKKTKKLAMEYGIEELPPETQAKAMQLIMLEVNDEFEMADFKYDVSMKVGTDGLKDIKINQMNMLMQQAGNLVGAGVVPAKILGLLMADMAEAMDRPDIAKMIETYEPQPDPMAQKAQELELAEKEANASKDKALAENAMARTRNTDAKTEETMQGIQPKLAKAAADTAKTFSDIETGELDSLANAHAATQGPQNDRGGKSVR